MPIHWDWEIDDKWEELSPMKVEIEVTLELVEGAKELNDEALDTWMWAVERQLEQLDLVRTANVVDFTVLG